MKTTPIRQQVALAAAIAEDKKAENIAILQMDKSSSAFTDYFLICTGTNPRQIQAIADDVQLQLKRNGNMANNVEGYNRAEWVLLDYVDFVVHIFSEKAREHYNLERLWKSAKKLTPADLKKPEVREKPEHIATSLVKRTGAKPRAAKKFSSRSASRASSTRAAAKSSSRRGASKTSRKMSSKVTARKKK